MYDPKNFSHKQYFLPQSYPPATRSKSPISDTSVKASSAQPDRKLTTLVTRSLAGSGAQADRDDCGAGVDPEESVRVHSD